MGRVSGLRPRRQRRGDDPARNGHDWTARFPAIARAAAALKVRSTIIDGEAVILDDRGQSSFAELQADLDRHGSDRAVLFAFDLLFLDGEDLRKQPLDERRLALGGIIPKRSAILMRGEWAEPARSALTPTDGQRRCKRLVRIESVPACELVGNTVWVPARPAGGDDQLPVVTACELQSESSKR